MVHDVVNLFRHELMQNRHRNGTIGQGSEECHRPISTVTTAEGNLVALHYAGVLKHDVQLFNLACHIVILQGGSLVVGQGIHIPMVYDAFLYKCVKARNFHILIHFSFYSLYSAS